MVCIQQRKGSIFIPVVTSKSWNSLWSNWLSSIISTLKSVSVSPDFRKTPREQRCRWTAPGGSRVPGKVYWGCSCDWGWAEVMGLQWKFQRQFVPLIRGNWGKNTKRKWTKKLEQHYKCIWWNSLHLLKFDYIFSYKFSSNQLENKNIISSLVGIQIGSDTGK